MDWRQSPQKLQVQSKNKPTNRKIKYNLITIAFCDMKMSSSRPLRYPQAYEEHFCCVHYYLELPLQTAMCQATRRVHAHETAMLCIKFLQPLKSHKRFRESHSLGLVPKPATTLPHWIRQLTCYLPPDFQSLKIVPTTDDDDDSAQ